jgi:hypothetical protein
LHDFRKVAVFERHGAETLVPPFQHLFHLGLLFTDVGFSKQLIESPLAGKKADERGWPIGLTAFDQLSEFRTFFGCFVCRARCKLEHDFIQEEDNCVVAESLGVLADERKTIIDIDELRCLTSGGENVRTRSPTSRLCSASRWGAAAA